MKQDEVAAVIGQAKAVQEESDAERMPVPAGYQESDFSIPLQKAGQYVHGMYLGEAEPMEISRIVDGEVDVRRVRAFSVQRFQDGAVIQVLGSTFLEKFLSARQPGEGVFIRRLGQRAGGRYGRLNDYQCAFGSKEDAAKEMAAQGHKPAPFLAARPAEVPSQS